MRQHRLGCQQLLARPMFKRAQRGGGSDQSLRLFAFVHELAVQRQRRTCHGECGKCLIHCDVFFFQDGIRFVVAIIPKDDLRPINRAVSEPPQVQLFAKFFGVLLHAVASKPISTTCLLVEFGLPPDVFIECQNPLVFHLREIHSPCPHTMPKPSLLL